MAKPHRTHKKSPAKPELKACRSCSCVLPFTEDFFPIGNHFRFGLRARCRQCLRKQGRDSDASLRLQVLQRYSDSLFPTCLCCGETQIEFLCLDHINGDGHLHRKTIKGATNAVHRDLIRRGFPPICRVLCHNCNRCLATYGHCVHDPERIFCTKPIQRKPAILLTPFAQFSGVGQACIKCARLFPVSDRFFPRNHKMPTGFLRTCKDCARLQRFQHGQVMKEARKARVFTHYSSGAPRCACCGVGRIEFLSIDHVAGGGRKHCKENKAHDLPRWLIQANFPSGFQVLCHNCNFAKKDRPHCPHQSQFAT